MNTGATLNLGPSILPQSGKTPSPKTSAGARETSGAHFSHVLGKNSPTGTKDLRKTHAENSNVQSQGLGGFKPTMPGRDSIALGRPVGAVVADPTQPDLLTVKSPEKAPESPAKIDTLTRRVVWQDFLRKMKDKLGVNAEQILKAFGSLSKEELNLPPEKNIGKLVGFLGLNPQQAEMAKGFFRELIQRTDSKTLGEEFQKSKQQISLSLMSQHEQQQQKLERSLKAMNSTFFMNGPSGPQASSGMHAPMSQQAHTLPDGMKATQNQTTADQDLLARLRGAGLHIPASQDGSGSASAVPNARLIAQQTSHHMAGDQKIAVKAGLSNAATANVASSGPSANPAAAKAGVVHGAGLSAGALNAMDAGAHAKNLMDKEADSGHGQNHGKGDHVDPKLNLQTIPLQAGEKTATPLGLQNAGTSVAGQPQPMQVPELIQQAQMMVHKGGGQMKVLLHPEGLGEVAMKVDVKGDKVKVEMITESEEAKKLIQKSFNALHDGLSHHKLNLESLKVDTASHLGHQLEQQYQDAQRQAAQQFLENFHRENSAWRRNFFDIPGAEVYRTQAKSTTDVTASSSSRRKAKADRRLDLVA